MTVNVAQFTRGGDNLPPLPVGPQEMAPTGRSEAVPRFYMDKVEVKTADGRLIYPDVERVEILIPGDMKSIVVQKVGDHHRRRWPQQYAAFKAGLTPTTVGQPLEYWGGLTPGQIATFKAFNVHSVENLSGLTDSQIQGMGMGVRALRERAKAWLEVQDKGGAVVQGQAEKIEALEQANAMKDQQIASLGASISALQQQLQYMNGAVQAGIAPQPVNQLVRGIMEQPAQPAVIQGPFGPIDNTGAAPAEAVPEVPLKRGPGRPPKSAA